MSLSAGTRLGRYEILSKAGAGGMGEVYRARDTRLDRIVAVKVLPAHLSTDPDLRERLEHEARALAALSHPAICPVHDIGHEEARTPEDVASGFSRKNEAIDFLVMEFLEGETLAAHLAKGPLALDLVLRFAREIAGALAAAHERGIVHRDLKPGNVMLCTSQVKLLDFGLAKRRVEGVEALPASAVTAAGLTSPGMVVGTPEYMAPEVIEGRDADPRADLFAFGAIVYEMATGRRAHAGVTPSAVMSAILYETPAALRTIRLDAPEGLDDLVSACLVKDPGRRWQSARDAGLVLDAAVARVSRGHQAAVTRPAGRTALPWAIAGAAVVAALAVTAWSRPWAGPAVDTTVRRVSVLPPPDTVFAPYETPQISPNGSRLLFVAVDGSGYRRLYVRSLDASDAQVVPGAEGATQPFWSHDSRGIGFFADGVLKIIDAAGASPRALARAPAPRGAAWGSDDVILFAPFPTRPTHRVAVRGGDASALVAGFGAHAFPQLLPGGRHFLYRTGPLGGIEHGQVFAVDVRTNASRSLVPTASGALYAPPGYLLLRRQNGDLVAFPFNVDTAEVSGAAVPVVPKLALNPITFQASFSVSENGVLAYLEAAPGSRISRLNRAGSWLADVSPAGIYQSICSSADGAQVAADGQELSSMNLDIWVLLKEAGAAARRLTFNEATDFYPVCSPDGSEVVFASLRGGAPDLYRVSTSAPGTETMLLDTPFPKIPLDWSADGAWLLYGQVTARGDFDVWALPMTGERTPRPVVATPSEEGGARLSADSRWVAYSSNETGHFEIYVESFPPTGPRWQVSRAGGLQPRWRADGRELFFLSGTQALTAVDVHVTDGSLQVGPPRTLFESRLAAIDALAATSQYLVSPKGDAFVVNRVSDEAEARAVSVIFNWTGLVKQP